MKRFCLVVSLLLLLSLSISCALLQDRHRALPDKETLPRAGVDTTRDARPGGITLTGGLIGAMAQGVMSPYTSEERRNRIETNKAYGYAHDRGTAARIESVRVTPRFVRPGGIIEMKLVYAVLTHSDENTVVKETREIWYGQNLLANPGIQAKRGGGTYESGMAISLPRGLREGTYKIRYMVQTPSSRDVREANVTVRASEP